LPMLPVAPPSLDYIPGLEEPQTPPAPQDEDEHKPMFIQPHDLDFVPEPIYTKYIPLEDEHILPAEEQPLPPAVLPTAESPGYVAESDLKEDPEEYEDDETEDGPVDYPIDEGDDGDDDDDNSSGYDADDRDEDEEEEEKEKEHLASADSSVVIPTDEPRQRDDIPESEQPPRKRLCLSTLSSRYEVGESSTRGRGVDYGFAYIVEAEMRHREDARDGRTRISQRVAMDSQRVDLLMGDRMTLQETVWIVEEEAYVAREAWAHLIGLSQTVHHELQTLREQVQIMAPVTRQGHNPPPPNTDTPPHHMTPESVQAMIDQALLRNSTNGDGSQSSHEDNPRNVQTTRHCFYADFMKCHPLNFKGNEGIVGLTRWIEKMESVFNISGCAIENQ
nr:hypothetical protein [Tanacetum cinerariifolium]